MIFAPRRSPKYYSQKAKEILETTIDKALVDRRNFLKEQSVKDDEEIARTEAMVDRMRTAATNASIAALGRAVHAKQTHLDRLRARRIKAPFVEVRQPAITLPEVEGDAEKTVLSVWDYEVAFDELLLSNVCFELHGNEKVAIVGANGTGKTTLLREIYKNKNGAISIAEDVKVGFLSQIHGEMLDENKNISAVGKAMAEVFNNAGISPPNTLLNSLNTFGHTYFSILTGTSFVSWGPSALS